MAVRLRQLQGRGTAGDATATAAVTEFAALFEPLRAFRHDLEDALAIQEANAVRAVVLDWDDGPLSEAASSFGILAMVR